ncbi:TPA: CPBP family intramembrane metalloprotease [Methanosarcinaceae archaeon]|nr:CPBP family intramembrane metalloprotease [Methanosarcinaceae archaeon]
MKNGTLDRPFSLKTYLLIIFALSWPFQIAYPFLGEAFRPLLLISMIMVAVGTYIAGKFVFRDGFENAGWQWGRPRHYVYAFGLALFLWGFPRVIEQLLGIYETPQDISLTTILAEFLLSFTITLIPAFGEEFGWRGYLLPRLFARYSTRRALLFHGFITWVWHLPVLVVMGIQMTGNPLVSVPLVMLVSLIPTVMHAVVFAYIWSSTQSLAVVTVYHAAFDEVRDTLEGSVGLGPLSQNWQMLILTILGVALLWKAKWKTKSENSLS